MIGVILAAGMARRLRPLTDDKPKCLLKVGERTLLERTVSAMQQAGITEFVVVTGYRGNMIRDFLEDYSKRTDFPTPSFTFCIMPITNTTTIFIHCGWLVKLYAVVNSC